MWEPGLRQGVEVSALENKVLWTGFSPQDPKQCSQMLHFGVLTTGVQHLKLTIQISSCTPVLRIPNSHVFRKMGVPGTSFSRPKQRGTAPEIGRQKPAPVLLCLGSQDRNFFGPLFAS